MRAALPLDAHFARPGDPLAAAFAERNLFPWIQRRTRPLENGPAHAARLLAEAKPGKRVAYLHVPFCANHCLFCGFYRNRSAAEAMAEYARRLEADIAMDEAAAAGPPIQAVYFGGGTPSALSAADLHRLITAVRRHLPLAADCEITVEGRVAGFDDEKIDACLEAGASRFSIGVQTFDTGLRQRMGRRATGPEAAAFMGRLRNRDRAVVVCDLIFGLPGQSMEMWRSDVETCLSLGLDGVDLYCLTLHDSSPLALSIAKGSLPPVAGLERMAAMYGAGLELLEDAGWRHLNQAHWAAATRERNLYNQLVKAGADCLAFGAGAGGLVQGHRYVIQPDVDAYAQAVDRGTKPVTVLLPPPPHRAARDLVMGGLEGGRLDVARLETLTAPGLAAAIEPLLAQWETAGLIRRRARSFALTTAGWFWHCNLVGSLFELIGLFMEDGDVPASLPSPTAQGMRHAG